MWTGRSLSSDGPIVNSASILSSIYLYLIYLWLILLFQTDLDLGQTIADKSAQIRACANIGAVYEAMQDIDKAISYHEQLLNIATLINDRVSRIKAFSNLGRIYHQNGDFKAAVSYLEQGIAIADQLQRNEDEASLRHRIGLALNQEGDLEGAQQQLETAACIFENIRREVKGQTSEFRMGLFDQQTACYQSLQHILVKLNRENEALIKAERSRTRAFFYLLQNSNVHNSNKFEDNTPSSIEEIEKIVNRQKASVLYFSLAAGNLYSWLIVPTKGIVKFNQVNPSGHNFFKYLPCVLGLPWRKR